MKSVLVPLRRSASRSVYALALLLIVGAGWAYLTQIDISVRSRGIVRPQDDPIRVIAEAAGRIKRVNVSEGATVRAGDAILELDGHDLQLKQSALESRIHFTELRLADIRRQLSDAASLDEQSASVDSFDRDAARRTAGTNVESARLRFNRTEMMFKGGLVSRQSYEESRMALTQAEAEETKLASKAMELKRSQSAAHLHDLEAGATPIRSDLAGLYHDLEQTKVDLGRLTITSPADGQVTSLAAFHADEILAAGTAVAAIVPAAHFLIIESWLPTADRSRVHANQLVRVQADSSGSDRSDAFDATVISISPDAQFNESLSGNYRVLITPGDDSPDLRLGMTFDVHFVTRQERLLWLLFDKVKREFD